MDFILIVILMAILYIVPEVLKSKRKPERYQYPDIPLPAPQPAKIEPEPPVMAAEELSTRTVLWTGQVTMATEPPISKKKTGEETPSLQSVISQEALINGVIFAEIIRPPRAYRPMRRRL